MSQPFHHHALIGGLEFSSSVECHRLDSKSWTQHLSKHRATTKIFKRKRPDDHHLPHFLQDRGPVLTHPNFSHPQISISTKTGNEKMCRWGVRLISLHWEWLRILAIVLCFSWMSEKIKTVIKWRSCHSMSLLVLLDNFWFEAICWHHFQIFSRWYLFGVFFSNPANSTGYDAIFTGNGRQDVAWRQDLFSLCEFLNLNSEWLWWTMKSTHNIIKKFYQHT